jgi:hypothetical protein
MAINSQAELQRMLDQIRSLDTPDVANIVRSAHHNANGRPDGMYAGLLVAKGSASEIEAFLRAAGASYPDYGGRSMATKCAQMRIPPATPCSVRISQRLLVLGGLEAAPMGVFSFVKCATASRSYQRAGRAASGEDAYRTRITERASLLLDTATAD